MVACVARNEWKVMSGRPIFSRAMRNVRSMVVGGSSHSSSMGEWNSMVSGLRELADVVLDERGERFGDRHDPLAAFGLRLAQPVFAPVVGAAVDGVTDMELQVLQVDIPELQGAYLAEA